MRWCLIDFGRISYSLLPSWFLQDFPGKSHSTHILISFLRLNHVEGNVNNPITLIIISFSLPKIERQQQADWMDRDTVVHSALLVFRGSDGFMKCHHDPNLLSRRELSFCKSEAQRSCFLLDKNIFLWWSLEFGGFDSLGFQDPGLHPKGDIFSPVLWGLIEMFETGFGQNICWFEHSEG